MSTFVPGHFNDYPPPLGEGTSHPERHQDTGQINLMISETLQVVVDNSVSGSLDDTSQASSEEPVQPVQPQDPGKTNLIFSEMPQVAINTDSVLDPLNDTLPGLSEECSHPECTQDPGEILLSGVQQVIITAIHATDLTLGLQWIPAGFHAVVKVDGAEYQTSNKAVNIDQVVVEWHEHILLVYASFELGPMVCHGEHLRTFEIAVGELLDRSEKSDHQYCLLQIRLTNANEHHSHCVSAKAGGSRIGLYFTVHESGAATFLSKRHRNYLSPYYPYIPRYGCVSTKDRCRTSSSRTIPQDAE
ncbi:hypothetical protein C8R48DRAFT_676024 [Suillus tomentosus]|nr:hypothetical protein C8R48DRAFT_676024 [Suillus tomentosus]